MRYLLTGGGTGGHVYPALAIADEIRRAEPDAQFLYVGLGNKLESKVVPGRGFRFRAVNSTGFPRSSGILAYLRFGVVLAWGVIRALWILLQYRPRVIVGTGGYVSAPIMFAYAILSRIGLSRAVVFSYEPNVHPGLLNQAVGGFAHRIGVAFEPAAREFDMKKVAVVGYPVRRELENLDPHWGVLGAVGAISALENGDAPKELRGHWCDPNGYFRFAPLPHEVDALDEQWLGLRKSRGVGFDPELPGVHCYGMDISLAAREQGFKSYAIDAFVWHKYRDRDGDLIQCPQDSKKIRERWSDDFMRSFSPSADYVEKKWSKFLPFQTTSWNWK